MVIALCRGLKFSFSIAQNLCTFNALEYANDLHYIFFDDNDYH
jgi:hypothetical protein